MYITATITFTIKQSLVGDLSGTVQHSTKLNKFLGSLEVKIV